MYRKNTSGQHFHVQGIDSATGGIKSGVTWTVRRCIDGTFAAATGTVTEDGTTGWYRFALSQADTNGNNIGFNFTGTGAIPQTVNIITTAADPTDTVRLGLTALPNAAAEASGGLPTLSAAQASNGTIQANVHRWLTGTPNALQSGRVDSYLGAVAAGVIAAASFAANALDAVWSTATRLLTAGTNIVLAKGTGITGFNDLSAADVNAEVDTALADYDGPTHAELTSELADADDAVLAAIAALDGALVVRRGTAQGIVEFSTNTLILDAGAVAETGFYAKNILVITGGTGAGQVRRINSYSTGRVATVDYIWTTTPDETSQFAILPDADVMNVSGNVYGVLSQLGGDAISAASLASDAATEIANRVWEDDNSVRTTTDTAGNKLRQALILYEGN